LTGSLLRMFRDLESKIAADAVSPEDIVEAEEADHEFKAMRQRLRDGFKSLFVSPEDEK